MPMMKDAAQHKNPARQLQLCEDKADETFEEITAKEVQKSKHLASAEKNIGQGLVAASFAQQLGDDSDVHWEK